MNVIPAALGLVVCLLVLASIWFWIRALLKILAGRPLLAYEPRNAAPWSLLEVFLTVLLTFLLQGLAVTWLAKSDTPPADTRPAVVADAEAEADVETAADAEAEAEADAEVEVAAEVEPAEVVESAEVADLDEARWAIVLGGLASLLACGLGGLVIVLRTGARWDLDLGLTLRHAGRDIGYGIVAYVMLAPIIYTIQSIMVQWYPTVHPLIVAFRANPNLRFYLVCVFSAGIMAPLVEEFMCRVLLQGWLERVFAASSVEEALFGTNVDRTRRSVAGSSLEATDFAEPDGAEPDEVASSEVEVKQEQVSPKPPSKAARRPSNLPILISSFVFASMHLGHGPDPIPLFVLALGLGYLYQRTHRILPCIVLHFLVNALALAVLAQSLVDP